MRSTGLALLALVFLATASACSRPEGKPAPAMSAKHQDPLGPASGMRDSSGESAIEYTLRFDQAHNHYVDVEMIAKTGGAAETTLMMAVWTPGSYLVREYARHMEDLRVLDDSGAPRLPRKTTTNRWLVDSSGTESLTVRYRLYGRLLSVRTNFINSDAAIIIGAATFLTIPERMGEIHDVLVVPRSGWQKTVSGLNAHPEGATNHFIATNYDELVDSPIVAGTPAESRFEAESVGHEIASFGVTDAWDVEKSTSDVEKLVREQLAFWKSAPFDRYVFLNTMLAPKGRNGLEHLNSTLLTVGRFIMTDDKSYRGWLGLVSHEYFHTWNGKRLRPASLGPFDYERETHTTDLWVVEGLTSYYDDLLMARAGLYTEAQYLEALGGQIARLQQTPGRLTQPLATASHDAWIKYYRGDENSKNSSVSYYTKGAVVGFLLDATIRRATSNRRSLDDVMLIAFERYGGDKGYTSQQFRDLASEVAGTDLSAFFATAVDRADELDYAPALEFFGLRFKPVNPPTDDDKKGGRLGLSSKTEGGRLMVSRVDKATPAFAAGINVGDELIAINNERVSSAGLGSALKRHKPGEAVSFTVARFSRLRTLEVTLDEPVAKAFKLERSPSRTASTAARAAGWLTSRAGH